MKKRLLVIAGLVSLVSLVAIIVSVMTHNKNKTTNIPTPSPTPELQSSNPDLPDDEKYSSALIAINEEYPWYSKLPIETRNYRIVYDFDKKMFRIRFLLEISSSQIATFTQNALDDLKDVGVREPIKYYLLDKNGNQL